MLDMFSIDLNTEQRLDALRDELARYNRNSKVDTKKAKIKLFYGDVNNFNDGVLTVSSPPKAKFFESPDDKFLSSILESIEIKKFFLTYDYLFFGDRPTTQTVKDFGYFIRRLVDIINPKLIVCLGEEPQFSFFKRKFLLSDFHGKQIGDYEGRPIYTTYPISYYEERSQFEDHSYKEAIKNKDWNAIRDKYKELK
jgi:hypothetical protein